MTESPRRKIWFRARSVPEGAVRALSHFETRALGAPAPRAFREDGAAELA
jgi:hypothetical protein